jgi:murein DD-endopeptidase MepM/ murein hydrolase activator NlpD
MNRPRSRRLLITMLVTQAGALHAQAARLTVSPSQPATGAIVRLTIDRVPPGDSVVSVRGSMAGEALHFQSIGASLHAIAGVPVEASDSVVARAVVQRASGAIDTLRVSLRFPHQPIPIAGGRGRGPSRRLTVDRRFTRPLDAATQARIDRENARARDIGRHAHDSPPMWTEPFLRPRAATVTSRFGTGRVFNGRVTSSHLGVDYRGAVGDTIKAANRGVVALVDSFFLAGNVVYIDHGGGVVTGYFHMSQPLVGTGDSVARGQTIGLVGATGRVTGPHLHWSARYGELSVDPGDLLTMTGMWYFGCGTTKCQH